MTTILKHYPIRSKIFHLNVFAFIYILFIFLGHASGKELTCQCRRHKRHGFSPWFGKIPWRRAWQPTPVFLPGESHGRRSLVGNIPQGGKELDMTEETQHASMHISYARLLFQVWERKLFHLIHRNKQKIEEIKDYIPNKRIR